METDLMERVDIEKELQKASSEAIGRQSVRASLFTLLVYSHAGGRAAHTQKVIEKVVTKFPCRVIRMTCHEGEAPLLKTHVSTQSLASGNVYCELIDIDFSHPCSEQIPFLVVPHLLSDLPIYLLWAHEPKEDEALFTPLAQWSHRILFDAGCVSDLCAFSHTLLTYGKTYDIIDLNWSLLSSWRDVLAQTFNDTKGLQSLKEATQIKIVSKAKCIEALYLHTWLAATFHWELLRLSSHAAVYQTPAGELEVLLEEKEGANSLCSVEVTNEREGTHYLLLLEKGDHVRVVFSDQTQCSLPVFERLTLTKEEQALTKEFFHPSTKPHYIRMLTQLARPPKYP